MVDLLMFLAVTHAMAFAAGGVLVYAVLRREPGTPVLGTLSDGAEELTDKAYRSNVARLNHAIEHARTARASRRIAALSQPIRTERPQLRLVASR